MENKSNEELVQELIDAAYLVERIDCAYQEGDNVPLDEFKAADLKLVEIREQIIWLLNNSNISFKNEE